MKQKSWINVLIMVGLLVSSGMLNIETSHTAHAETTAIIWYVENGAPSGRSCTSWAEACSLYYAVINAVSGTEIWVPAGTYLYDGGRDVSIRMKSGVAMYGGFDGDETSRDQRNPDPATNGTVLSGDRGTAGDPSDNPYHVVIAGGVDETAILDGFTITGGNANGTYPNDCGGGLLIGDIFNSGSPTLNNLIISGNSADYGGGMYNYNNSSPTLTNVTFSDNTAGSNSSSNDDGGGMYNYSSSPTLINVTFRRNYSVDYNGGGMYNSHSHPTLTNVTFIDNKADLGGGMVNGGSSPVLTNVTFNGNSAYEGGGMYSLDSSPSVRNSILWNNQDSSGTGSITATIALDSSSTITLTHSLVQGSGGSDSWIGGSYVDGGNNLDNDPKFVDADGADDSPGTEDDNLRLQTSSPAIDAGDNQYVTSITTDLDGQPRINGGTVDMGAYEKDCFKLFFPLTQRNR